MKDSYKVKQLEEMLAYEKAQPENEKYGASSALERARKAYPA